MACKKNGRATRAKKSPRRAGPPKKSAIKVRTGHYIVGKTRRRAVWVPKVLVDKGIIKVKKDVKFRVNKMNGKSI
jgi:hypothetical protein